MQEEESQLVVNPQVTMDPTLPRTEDVQCPNCNKSEAVFFTASTRDLDKSMLNRCNHNTWIPGKEFWIVRFAPLCRLSKDY